VAVLSVPSGAMGRRAKPTEEGAAAGKRLAALRKRQDISQPTAATRANVGYRSYQSWESGRVEPRKASREKLAKLYGVEPGYFRWAQPATEDVVTLERIADRLDGMHSDIRSIADQLGTSRPDGDEFGPDPADELGQALGAADPSAGNPGQTEHGPEGDARTGSGP
jgi:transcriptional regulator with XRE-family HTH domain